MMDKLEKFIIENRDDFNIHEPSAAVWDKIQKSTKSQKVKKLNWRTVVWRAAVVIVIFASAFMLSEIIDIDKDGIVSRRREKKIEQIPQLAEAEAYYTSMVNDRLQEINTYFGDNPEVKKEIQKDLSELDSMYEDLKEDLYDNIATQEIIEAMIQNYRLKLEILEDILSELTEQEKTIENEKIEYEL
ncbi:hypothetical protein ACFLTE_05120 [Bacteroidota bacterium]